MRLLLKISDTGWCLGQVVDLSGYGINKFSGIRFVDVRADRTLI